MGKINLGTRKRPLSFWSHMEYEQMRQIVAQSTSTTQTAQAFRNAFGISAPSRREKPVDYERLMRQRIGALDRGR